jgi:hypothetical protein
MNKKYLIAGIVVVLVGMYVPISYFLTPGGVSATREIYDPQIKYIEISESFLERYPVVKTVMDGIDSMSGIYVDANGNEQLQTIGNPAHETVSNTDARNLHSALDELKPESPGYDWGYHVEYHKKYYIIGIGICFLYCGGPPM